LQAQAAKAAFVAEGLKRPSLLGQRRSKKGKLFLDAHLAPARLRICLDAYKIKQP